MAKIAGRKNEAAWQSANNWLERAAPATVAALALAFENSQFGMAAFTALQNYCIQTGVPLPDTAQSYTGWIAWMCDNGFPVDVFLGKVQYDVYDKQVGPEGNTIYQPTFGPTLAKFAQTVRSLIKRFQFADRQVTWVTRDTHPAPPSAAEVKAARKANPVVWQAERRAKIDAATEVLRASGYRYEEQPLRKTKKKALTKLKA